MYESSTHITQPVGNNALSYKERIILGSEGKLYIPSLIQGTVDDLGLGSDICFEEAEFTESRFSGTKNGKLVSCTGLKNFLQTTFHDTPVYIVDNHNHALSFWLIQHVNSLTRKPVNLIHVDQHSDIKENEYIFSEGNIENFVNEKTNVGNFITAAVNAGIINDVIQVRTDYALNEFVNPLTRKPVNYILDLDIDFRAGKKISEDDIKIIRQLMDNAKMVTIATSPYFMDQVEAITIIKKLCKE